MLQRISSILRAGIEPDLDPTAEGGADAAAATAEHPAATLAAHGHVVQRRRSIAFETLADPAAAAAAAAAVTTIALPEAPFAGRIHLAPRPAGRRHSVVAGATAVIDRLPPAEPDPPDPPPPPPPPLPTSPPPTRWRKQAAGAVGQEGAMVTAEVAGPNSGFVMAKPLQPAPWLQPHQSTQLPGGVRSDADAAAAARAGGLKPPQAAFFPPPPPNKARSRRVLLAAAGASFPPPAPPQTAAQARAAAARRAATSGGVLHLRGVLGAESAAAGSVAAAASALWTGGGGGGPKLGLKLQALGREGASGLLPPLTSRF